MLAGFLLLGSTAGLEGDAFALAVAGLACFLAVSFVVLAEGRGNDPAWGIGLAPDTFGPQGMGEVGEHAIDLRCAALAREFGLTRREEEVLCLLARDHPAADIERRLCVSNATVKTHTQAVYRKLGVHGRREVVALVDGEN